MGQGLIGHWLPPCLGHTFTSGHADTEQEDDDDDDDEDDEEDDDDEDVQHTTLLLVVLILNMMMLASWGRVARLVFGCPHVLVWSLYFLFGNTTSAGQKWHISLKDSEMSTKTLLLWFCRLFLSLFSHLCFEVLEPQEFKQLVEELAGGGSVTHDT